MCAQRNLWSVCASLESGLSKVSPPDVAIKLWLSTRHPVKICLIVRMHWLIKMYVRAYSLGGRLKRPYSRVTVQLKFRGGFWGGLGGGWCRGGGAVSWTPDFALKFHFHGKLWRKKMGYSIYPNYSHPFLFFNKSILLHMNVCKILLGESQTARSVAFYLGLHCLHRFVCLNT